MIRYLALLMVVVAQDRVVVDEGQGDCVLACDRWIRWTLSVTGGRVAVEEQLPIRQR